jgi:hypothetical protein
MSGAGAFSARIDALIVQHGLAHAQYIVDGAPHREYSIKMARGGIDADRVNVGFVAKHVTPGFLRDLAALAGPRADNVERFFTEAAGGASLIGISHSGGGIEAYAETRADGRFAVGRVRAYDAGKDERTTYEEVFARRAVAAVYELYRDTLDGALYHAFIDVVPMRDCHNIYVHRHPNIALGCQFAPAGKPIVGEALPRLMALARACGADTAATEAYLRDRADHALAWVGLYIHNDGSAILKYYVRPPAPLI